MTNTVIAINEEDAAFDAAQAAIAAGEVIVLPTDTVYGVGADATSGAAVQRLLDAKERGRDFPPPVLIAEAAMVRALAVGVDDRFTALAEAFWPGALTLVLKARETLRMDLGDRGETIAVRVPDQEFTRELLRRTGPLAVSSANVHGRPAATTIEEALEQLGERCTVYLDAGTMDGNTPSTIVDLIGPQARVLREGRISAAQLNEAVPNLVEIPEPESTEAESTETESTEAEAAEAQATEPESTENGATEPASDDTASDDAASDDTADTASEAGDHDTTADRPQRADGAVEG